MQDDDFSTFWRNDTHAQGLFYDLLARSEQAAYDDDFLMQLAAYRKAAPTSERADIFAAKYLLHHGDIENAAVCAERAREKRPLNYEIWKIPSPSPTKPSTARWTLSICRDFPTGSTERRNLH